MTDITRIPEDLCWTADNGGHENIPIGRIVRDQATEIERLRSALRFGCGAAINSLPPGEREWSPTSGIGVMLKALGCGALVYGDEVRAALGDEQSAQEK